MHVCMYAGRGLRRFYVLPECCVVCVHTGSVCAFDVQRVSGGCVAGSWVCCPGVLLPGVWRVLLCLCV